MNKKELATILFNEIIRNDECYECMFCKENDDGSIECRLNFMSCLYDGNEVIDSDCNASEEEIEKHLQEIMDRESDKQ